MKLFAPTDRDWIEDFSHENGNYQNSCMECKQTFMGHKRRVICKKCATPDWEEISKRKPPEDTKDNKSWAGAWLEGEMVGYAKCMVEKKAEINKLNEEAENYCSVMIAAAEEIQDHWQAHCDEDGYGPANLMHRLEKGIPASYGYKAGDFIKMFDENEQLKFDLGVRKTQLNDAVKVCDSLRKLNIELIEALEICIIAQGSTERARAFAHAKSVLTKSKDKSTVIITDRNGDSVETTKDI